MRLLLVEDDSMIGEAARQGLRQEGHTVDWVRDGREADAAVAAAPYDAVLLDLGLPRRDGLSLLKSWRAHNVTVPVLIITARDAVSDRVSGLDAGADDYLVKPFALEELLARVRALLRRSAPEEDGADAALRFGDLALDTVAYTVHRGARPLELTRTAFALLELFLRHPRQVLTRAIIFDRVWGYDFGPASNSLEVYVGYLRRKTEAGGEPRLLHTVRGVGYVLRDAP